MEGTAGVVGPGGNSSPPGRWLSACVSFLAHLGVATLLVPIVLTCADILWRRIVGGAFVDTFDITELCLVAAASLSIPYGFTKGTHITVDLLAERFSPDIRTILDTLISFVSAIFLGFLLWLSWQSAAQSYAYGDTSPNLRIPMVYYWSIFLLGLCLATLATLARSVEGAGKLRRVTGQ